MKQVPFTEIKSYKVQLLHRARQLDKLFKLNKLSTKSVNLDGWLQ